MQGRVFALLVGITNYKDSISIDNGTVYFNSLRGCIDDAKKIGDFLETTGKKVFLEELYNVQATKEAICHKFINHLGKAERDDSILFYFSGNGAQEEADPCFKIETSRNIESLVTYFSGQPDEDFLIADKELRYLVGWATKNGAACTVILDCCYSGVATRNAEVLEVNFNSPIEKRSRWSYVFGRRKWKSFIFCDELLPIDFKTKGIYALPVGDYVVYVASELDQSAVEIGGEGVFTKHLVEVLATTGGILSNAELYDRVRLRMKHAYLQTPRMLFSSPSSELGEKQFLVGRPLAADQSASAFYTQQDGWVINRGALHGIDRELRTIQLVDAVDPQHIIQAVIDNVGVNETRISPLGNIDRTTTYAADVDSLSRGVLKLFLNIGGAIPKDALALITAIDSIPKSSVQWVGKETDADLSLQHLQGVYYLTRPDDSCRPIAESAKFHNHQSIVEQLRQISRWKFLKELSTKTKDGLNKNDILKVEFIIDDFTDDLPLSDESRCVIVLEDWKRDSMGYSEILQVRFKNVSDRNIYLAVLYLDLNFSSTTALLLPSPKLIEPDVTAYLHVRNDINLVATLVPHASYFNYKSYREHLKVIIDDKPFDTYMFQMEPLAEPPIPGMEAMRHLKTKGIYQVESPRPLSTGRWFVSTIDIRSKNPDYNQVPFSIIREMLADRITSTYVILLFFGPVQTERMPFSIALGLRPEINMNISADEELPYDNEPLSTELTELAMQSWYRRRSQFYEEIASRFPERMKVLAMGDAWLLHPLVKDTVDYLSTMYAVEVFRWTGDMSVFTNTDSLESSNFSSLVKARAPGAVLLSMGGDDLFGSEFRKFLVDRVDPEHARATVPRFLTDRFDVELDRVMRKITAIASFFVARFPGVKLIVHGYDYPIAIDDPEKSHVGWYMRSCGVTEESDRKAVVATVIDRFNEELHRLADLFPETVLYLDLRGTVSGLTGPGDHWDTEAIPSRDGFQQMALRYIKLIAKEDEKKSFWG
jgi:Caspase domain